MRAKLLPEDRKAIVAAASGRGVPNTWLIGQALRDTFLDASAADIDALVRRATEHENNTHRKAGGNV